MRREQTDSREAPWNPLPHEALPGGSRARRMGFLVVDQGDESGQEAGHGRPRLPKAKRTGLCL